MSLASVLAALGVSQCEVRQATSVGGGDCSESYRIETSERILFVKLNRPDLKPMFEAEAQALRAIESTNTVRVPRVCLTGGDHAASWIVLEWLNLTPGGEWASAQLGGELARMHRHRSELFGWHADNFIGLSHQPNAATSSWLEFFTDQRLGAQRKLIARRPALCTMLEPLDRLITQMPALLGDHHPEPSLLHGDLWSGNWAAVDDGVAVIYDPASYYGDRETDLAMTRLFGGFSPSFYAAYEIEWPLPVGYQAREPIYQLYHLLNHANLFGDGYVQQAIRMMLKILNGDERR